MLLTRTWFICGTLALALHSCSPQEENSTETPSYKDTGAAARDTVRNDDNTPDPGTKGSEVPAENTNRSKDWHTLLKEYRDIHCRQHNGTSTTTDKIRLAELDKELNLAQKNLPADDQAEFVSEKAKAIDTESCP